MRAEANKSSPSDKRLSAPRPQAMLGLVAVGLGVTIVPETIAKLPAPGVVFRPLKQRLLYGHVVLWQAKSTCSPVWAFLDTLPGSTTDGTGR